MSWLALDEGGEEEAISPVEKSFCLLVSMSFQYPYFLGIQEDCGGPPQKQKGCTTSKREEFHFLEWRYLEEAHID